MYPHFIRLRGPWKCQPLSPQGEPLGEPIRMKMPCRWRETSLGEYRGRARLTRHFGYPGRIDPHERVWLKMVGWGWQGAAAIQLNGETLGERLLPLPGPIEFDVTSLLEQRNTLHLDLLDETGAGGLTGQVAMEIRCTAYLQAVRAKWTREELRVKGRLVGECDRPLDLYCLCNGQNFGYQELSTSPDDRPFEFALRELPDGLKDTISIRLELVNVSTVWYAVELLVEAP